MKTSIVLISFLALLPASLLAQVYVPPYNPGLALLNDSIRVTDEDENETVSSNSTSQAVLIYSPNKSRTRANLSAMAQRMKASDPNNAAQMDQLFSSSDVVGSVERVMDNLGLQRNNIAHAYAVYWVTYWGLANKVYDAPSSGAMQAVARQAANGFTANPEFAKMDNAKKQQVAEELMALAAIMDATSERVKSYPELAAQAAKAALRGSKTSGLGLEKIILTEEGFRPAGNTVLGTKH
jgi:hypothetical protein